MIFFSCFLQFLFERFLSFRPTFDDHGLLDSKIIVQGKEIENLMNVQFIKAHIQIYKKMSLF